MSDGSAQGFCRHLGEQFNAAPDSFREIDLTIHRPKPSNSPSLPGVYSGYCKARVQT
jgi:hypothetical protein